jgi:hypothetical protein
MASSTKSAPRRSIRTVELSTDDKDQLAGEISDLFDRKLVVEFVGLAEINYGLFDCERGDSKGHVWEVRIPEIEGENDMKSWLLDDRDGEIRLQIAESMLKRSKLLSRWADKIMNSEFTIGCACD